MKLQRILRTVNSSAVQKRFFSATASVSHQDVKDYYGKVLETNNDLATNACTTSAAPTEMVKKALKNVPGEILAKFYGCGNPVPLGVEGCTILDLGSGSGRDVYLASQLVGPEGKVVGIDMTEEQIAVANEHVDSFTQKMGYPEPNMRFVQGYIEDLTGAGVEENSVDLIISNCVINLSPRKDLVLEECYKVLKEGGEVYFSDVYCDRRLPQHVLDHKVLWGECIAGALYIEDFKRLCHKIGFTDPRVLETSTMEVTNPELKKFLGNAKFYSITYRLFKLPQLETLCEDYGQVGIYKGTCTGHPHGYELDDHHFFETNKPMLVCGNTASMVGESWMRDNFTILGNRDTHFGLFDCSPVSVTPSSGGDAAPATGGCC